VRLLPTLLKRSSVIPRRLAHRLVSTTRRGASPPSQILDRANDWGKSIWAPMPDAKPGEFGRPLQEQPSQSRAFLQVIGSVGSPHFLVMVWRILQGLNITAITWNTTLTSRFTSTLS